MCKDPGNMFRVFIHKDSVNGKQLLSMGDSVKVDFNEFFMHGGEIYFDIKRVISDTGKKFLE